MLCSTDLVSLTASRHFLWLIAQILRAGQNTNIAISEWRSSGGASFNKNAGDLARVLTRQRGMVPGEVDSDVAGEFTCHWWCRKVGTTPEKRTKPKTIRDISYRFPKPGKNVSEGRRSPEG